MLLATIDRTCHVLLVLIASALGGLVIARALPPGEASALAYAAAGLAGYTLGTLAHAAVERLLHDAARRP